MATSSGLVRSLMRLMKTAAGSAVYAIIAFLGAGHFNWIRGWIYVAVFVGVSIAGGLVVEYANPGLLETRAKGIRKDTKSFDKVFYLMFLPLVLIYPLLGGMDAARFFWSPLPWWTIYPGALLFLIGSALTAWTMIVNRYAETTVRIQDDRGHTVVTSGPYRIVRHPMYVGTIIGFPGSALMLGSGLALVPMTFLMMLFVWRTAHEDHTLRRELTGYEDYIKITPYRLVPGIW